MGSETHTPAEVGTLSGNGAAAVELETDKKSRRALLKGLGVAAAGAVVGSVLSPDEAEAHGTFHRDSNDFTPAIHGNNTSNGPGVHGGSFSGDGVFGFSSNGTGVLAGGGNIGVEAIGRNIGVAARATESGPGVTGFSFGGTGVEGRSNSGTGVEGISDSGGTGVVGSSDSGIGVDGSSERLIGVNGFSDIGIGVEARSNSGIGVDGTGGNVGVIGNSDSGTGVLARNFGNGLALDVHGPAKFSTAGAGTIPAQQSSVVVNDSAVTADSHITMTLTGNPGSVGSGLPAVVVWIERQPGTGFTARLSRKVSNATPFTYLIVEPG